MSSQQQIDLLDGELICSLKEILDKRVFYLYLRLTSKDQQPFQLLDKQSSPANTALVEQQLKHLKTQYHKIRFSRLGKDSLYSLPVVFGDEFYGCLFVTGLTSSDQKIIHLCQACLDIYIHQRHLLLQSNTDPLTQLLNRQTLETTLLKVLTPTPGCPSSRATDKKTAWYMALMDLDNFKQINDNFGHVIGDEVLLIFAQLTQASFRQHDYLFRYGGEEFAAIFQCENTCQVENILNRARITIGEHAFSQVGHVSVSIGFTRLSKQLTVPDLFHQADKALYYSKNQGKDRVSNFEQIKDHGSDIGNDDNIELF